MDDNDLDNLPTPLRPRAGRLDTITAVRTEMAKLYREARAGTIDLADATKLCYMLQCLHKCVESSELEQKLLAIEAKVEGAE